MMEVGAAVVEIIPAAGLSMAGFGVRTEPALGAHDALTVRAVAVNDTALVAVDVLGLDISTTRSIKRRSALPEDRVIITAVHNHGGPETLRNHHQRGIDEAYMARLEAACAQAIDRALAERRPAGLRIGMGADPAVAKNRRHPGGNTDTRLPVAEFVTPDGMPIATLVSYACHPVVLGADNRLWTADYPAYVRRRIEAARPGTTAMFFTGCCGDANTGHSAHASNTLVGNSARTYETAERLGTRIAECALAAPLGDSDGPIEVASAPVELSFERRERRSMPELAAAWRREREKADRAGAILLTNWIEWAERGLPADFAALRMPTRVSALRWGDLEIAALPGEIFAETAQDVRRRLGNDRAFVLSMADDNPGYIPPISEFAFGGYEVEEAHRYYGYPATFAPGSAERLADAAVTLMRRLRNAPTS